MLDSSGPDCPFPGLTQEHDGGRFEIYSGGIAWGTGGGTPTVLLMDNIEEIMPLHVVMIMPYLPRIAWLPIRIKGGACIFVNLVRNGWRAERGLEAEARAIILKQRSPAVPAVAETPRP